MKTGAIYVRRSVSTDKGESIKSQVEMCKTYAKTQGITIDESLIYCDEGYSGKDTNRPKFKQMINDLKRKEFEVLLCYRLDRISRSLNDFSALIDTMKAFDISFISIKEKFDTSTPMGNSMMYIASVFSELERETISERIKDNMASLSHSGRWLGGVTPTGFKSTLVTSLDDNLNKKKVYKLSAISSEISLVCFLFNMFLKLKSLAKLEEYCYRHKIKSKNNLLFSQSSLRQILINPVYCIGDKYLYDYLKSKNFTISNDRSKFNGSCSVLSYKINNSTFISLARHKGIIKSRDWIDVQRIVLENSKLASRQGTSSIGLLSGLIYCDLCSNLMRVKHGRRTKTGLSYYYLCTLKEGDKKNCSSLNLKGIYIDDLVFIRIKNLLAINDISSIFLRFLITDRKLLINNSLFYKDRQSDTRDDEIKHLEDKLNRLKLQIKGDMSSSSYKHICKEIKSIESRMLDLSEVSANSNSEEDDLQLMNKIDRYYKNILLETNVFDLDFKEKKYLVNQVLDSLYWDNSKISMVFK